MKNDADFLCNNLSSAASQQRLAKLVLRLKDLYSHAILLNHPDASEDLTAIFFKRVIKESRNWLRRNRESMTNVQHTDSEEEFECYDRESTRKKVQESSPSSKVVEGIPSPLRVSRNLRRNPWRPQIDSSNESNDEMLTHERISTKSSLSTGITTFDAQTPSTLGPSFENKIASDASHR